MTTFTAAGGVRFTDTEDRVNFIAGYRGVSDGGGGGTVDVVSNVATSTILGRVTSGSGDSEELTATQVRTLLDLASLYQPLDSDLTSIAALSTTSYGRAFLALADAAAARSAIGLTAHIVGGQDEGPVVTGTSAATLLDGTVTLTGDAGDAWDIVAAGRWNNQSGGTGAPRIVLRLGASDIFTYSPTATASNAADRLWRLEATIRAESTTDLNISAVGYYLTGLIVLGGTSSGNVGSGLALDVQGYADAGTPKEVQLTQLTVTRSKATA